MKVTPEFKASFFKRAVEDRTLAKIQSFLEEVANGTSDYKSVHNLTREVEHQYKGRFLMELLQNAHDALSEFPAPTRDGRIRFVLTAKEGKHGTLYAANDGIPFTSNNFEHLIKFGQSDKDPLKSIGNKGIGFRSVLEISDSPEIYSRGMSESLGFDGYCFRFEPHTAKLFEEPIRQLLSESIWPCSPFDGNTTLVDWTESKRDMLRGRQENGQYLATTEMRFLSPYLLPLPADVPVDDTILSELALDGYATVIRLPIKNAEAFATSVDAMESIEHTVVLFLRRVRSFICDTNNGTREWKRTEKKLRDPMGGMEVRVVTNGVTDSPSAARYMLWERMIGGESDPKGLERIRAATAKLGGRWTEVKEATVSVAVATGDTPENGKVHIFLPTKVDSGCGAHVNGPFFGDIARTIVDFTKDYNRILWEAAVSLASEVIQYSLVGKGLREARAIVDFLAPVSLENFQGQKWLELIMKIIRLSPLKSKFAFTEKEIWLPLSAARFLREEWIENKLLSPKLISRNASFDLYHSGMAGRRLRIQNLLMRIEAPEPFPTQNELKSTLARIARVLKKKRTKDEWNLFWYDIQKMVPSSHALLECKLLLGEDSKLHSAEESRTVFFRPGNTPSDDDELEGDAIPRIPECLSRRIAFLNSCIKLVEQKGNRRESTDVYKYLSHDLVRSFRTQDVLKAVRLQFSNLPLPIDTPDLGEVAEWGLKLASAQRQKRPKAGTPAALSDLPVPCRGGWYPLKEANFGPGWEDTPGQDLLSWLTATAEENALNRILLPPDDSHWGFNPTEFHEILEEAGVASGLRLNRTGPEEWSSVVSAGDSTQIPLPEACPRRFEPGFWKEYRSWSQRNLHVEYARPRDHKVQEVFSFAGMWMIDSIDHKAAGALSRLLLFSAPRWAKGWQNIVIKPLQGDYSALGESPLKYWLRSRPWIFAGDHEDAWRFRPSERWFIPTSWRSYHTHCRHLNPVPFEILMQIDRSEGARQLLVELGMPVYDPNPKQEADPRLLEDLAEALEDNPGSIVNLPFFIGQIRAAWKQFYPKPGGPFPKTLIVRAGKSGLKSVRPSEDNPVYFRDKEDEHLMFENDLVVEMPTTEVRRLRDRLVETYGEGLRFTSERVQEPWVDGHPFTAGGKPLADSLLAWTIPLVLALRCHYGPNSAGAPSSSFDEAVKKVRECSVLVCQKVEVRVKRGDEVLHTAPVDAFWSAGRKTLLVSSACMGKPALLSGVLQNIIGREDLEVPLKLVLGKFEGMEEPSDESAILALGEVHIDRSQYENVKHLWLGELGSRIRLLMPALKILRPTADLTRLETVTSEDALRKLLLEFGLEDSDVRELLNLAGKSNGFGHFGRTLFDTRGSEFQLGGWNQALRACGADSLINENAAEEFQSTLREARVPLLSILGRIAAGKNQRFSEMMKSLLEYACAETLAQSLWEIKFQDAMHALQPLLREMGANEDEVSAMDVSMDAASLSNALTALGLDTSVDHVKLQCENVSRCASLLDRIQSIGVFWCTKNDPTAEGWKMDPEDMRQKARELLDDAGFLDTFDESQCFDLIRKGLKRPASQTEFFARLDEANDVADLMSRIGCSEKDLADTAALREGLAEETRRRRRLVNVAGKEFDSGNLDKLWNHLTSQIEAASLPTINIGHFAELDPPPIPQNGEVSSGGGGGGGGGGSGRGGRRSNNRDELTGLAGEIQAFRALEKKYGSKVVHAGCWRSFNSLKVFPENPATDEYLGYDMELTLEDGRTWLIEVKSTEGDKPFFIMGPTEVKAAKKAAGKSDKRSYVILRVTQALSNSPSMFFLPNPLDRRHKGKFIMDGLNMYVGFRRK